MTSTDKVEAARAAIAKYLHQLSISRGIDKEEIIAMHIGDEREASLRASDLRTLLAPHAAQAEEIVTLKRLLRAANHTAMTEIDRATSAEAQVKAVEERAAQASAIIRTALARAADLGTVRAFIEAALDFTTNDTEALAEGALWADPEPAALTQPPTGPVALEEQR